MWWGAQQAGDPPDARGQMRGGVLELWNLLSGVRFINSYLVANKAFASVAVCERNQSTPPVAQDAATALRGVLYRVAYHR